MDKKDIIENLGNILTPSQVNTDSEDLYDASADRYKKYAKVRRVLDVPVPLAIIYPASAKEVSQVLAFCNEHGLNVIPRAGKTATEGGLENWKDNTIVLDARHLDKILNIDFYNMQATVQAGVPLQELEDALQKQGFTTGHSPQSKPGGKVRGACGHKEYRSVLNALWGHRGHGCGTGMCVPRRHISRIKNVARRAGGPDIRHIVIGNEGSLCYITEVTVKIFPVLS